MNTKRNASILGAIVAVAIISIIAISENTDAGAPAYYKMNVTVEMEDIFEMSPGQTMTIPLSLVNLDTEHASSVNVYVTEQGNEVFENNAGFAFTNNVDVSLSKSSSTLDASTAESLQKDPMHVTVSVPENAAPGLYEYSLIVEIANDSHQYRKYFYISVE